MMETISTHKENGFVVCHQRSTEKKYQIVNGTYYDDRTNKEVIDILEKYRKNQEFIVIHYGHTTGDKTGLDWLEENDVRGRIGRSTGSIKVPLMVESGQIGGDAILDHCIIRIRRYGNDLYRHPQYRHGTVIVNNNEVLINGKLHATFNDNLTALSWCKRLGLTVDMTLPIL